MFRSTAYARKDGFRTFLLGDIQIAGRICFRFIHDSEQSRQLP